MSLRTHRPSVPLRHLVLLLLPAVLVLAGCAEQFPQTTLLPRGEFAHLVDVLFRKTVFWATIVFVLVEGALVYAIFRFRGKPDDPEPEQVHGNTGLEVIWTIIPAFILAMIAVPTVQTIFRTAQVPTDNPVEVEVYGHQWWWEFRYPALGIITANELHVPVGRTVDLKLNAPDVVHSFWIPALAGKRDLIPTRVNRLWVKAAAAGNYPGQCAEFCGIEHARMGFRVIAEDSAAFDAWASRQTAPGPDAVAQDSGYQAGKEIFLTGGCVGCHAMAGQVTEKLTNLPGPNLSHVGSRTTIVAGLFTNTPEHLATWLRDPQKVKQGSLMKLPRPLTEPEIATLVAYLRAHQ